MHVSSKQNKAPQPRLSAFHLFTYKDLKDAERKGQHSLGMSWICPAHGIGYRTKRCTCKFNAKTIEQQKSSMHHHKIFSPGFAIPSEGPLPLPWPLQWKSWSDTKSPSRDQSSSWGNRLNAQRVLLDMDTSNIAKSPQTC